MFEVIQDPTYLQVPNYLCDKKPTMTANVESVSMDSAVKLVTLHSPIGVPTCHRAFPIVPILYFVVYFSIKNCLWRESGEVVSFWKMYIEKIEGVLEFFWWVSISGVGIIRQV